MVMGLGGWMVVVTVSLMVDGSIYIWDGARWIGVAHTVVFSFRNPRSGFSVLVGCAA